MALSFREKYSFGIGAFGKDIILAYVNIFLMIYFTDVLYNLWLCHLEKNILLV